MMKNLLLLFFLGFLTVSFASAQSDTDSISRVFELGEVRITGKLTTEREYTLSKEEILQQSHNNIAESLEKVPGIVFNQIGSRNESSILIRGFDTRQVPLLIDGIPVYISYDGNIDLSRFLSWNYEKISISKGFASMLYGPNTMGGAINLISSKPVEKFELDAYGGITGGNEGLNGSMDNLKIGGRLGNFFYQAGVSWFNQESWSLSGKYEPVGDFEGGRRDNSYEKDIHASFRLGLITKDESEYVISYQRQDGEKGIPPYRGETVSTRYWQMPDWNKESLYFNSGTNLGGKTRMILRAYYDKYYNYLRSYDDSTYSSQTFGYAFNSLYDDYSLGSNLELKHSFMNHNLAFGFQYKMDVHKEKNADDYPYLEFSDQIFYIALEDSWKINEKFTLTSGISWNYKENLEAEEYFYSADSISDMESGNSDKLNYRIGIQYLTGSDHQFWINSSGNSRFATLKERYSYRLGTSLPNPDLQAEYANHFIAGYRWRTRKFIASAEIFYILSKNKIAYTNIDPSVIRYENIEKSVSKGVETEIRYSVFENFQAGISYSYLSIRNPEDKDFYFIDIPAHNLQAFLKLEILDRLRIHGTYSYISERDSYTDGSYKAKAYGKTDMDLSYEFINGLSIKASVYNILDKDYLFSEGYPAPGRNFRIGIRYNYN